MKNKKRTLKQNRIIHALLNKYGCSTDDKAEMVYDITQGRTESTKEMYESEADVMIRRLGGSTQPVSRKSRRTVNYQRQKMGVAQLITKKQEDYLRDLVKKRNISEPGLRSLCEKIIKKSFPRTTKDGNKVIEALKSMIRRDANPNTSTSKKEAA